MGRCSFNLRPRVKGGGMHCPDRAACVGPILKDSYLGTACEHGLTGVTSCTKCRTDRREVVGYSPCEAGRPQCRRTHREIGDELEARVAFAAGPR
eukprot:6483417-Amphidinium_carterae.1